MKRVICIFFFVLGCTLSAWTNNVRIEGDVRVKDSDVVDGIATVKIHVKWNNSWRDAFNYDAVYIFLKYKVDAADQVWHHAYLEPGGHTLSAGYSYLMSNSQAGVAGKEKHNEGLFIYRDGIGAGEADVELELKWDIKSNPDKPLERDLFTSGSVFLSAMGIEMVYIPRGAFRAGDTRSSKTFTNKYMTLPASKDILTDANVDKCESAEPMNPKYPPAFAINHMNDIARDSSNAWVGRAQALDPTAGYVDYWKVTLKAAQNIRSFAIESIEGGTPELWQLQGLEASGAWRTIYPKYGDENSYADGSEWQVNSHRTYPCTRTLSIDKSFREKYVVYRILIKQTKNAPVIKNVAMSTEDVADQVDNSVLIYDTRSTMSNRYGLFAEDEDEWSGQTPEFYPNGYGAYFVMKYEISQEQYVAFLNKLTAPQQRTRTIGSALEALQEGKYVFGEDKSRPNSRNGIKLASIGVNDAPYVFANDLDPKTDYSQDGDGQTIACNFLNAGDMLAYADWCGLRPLTEMEYEKMARRPFPEEAIRGEYAWNTATNFVKATQFKGITAGKKSEALDNGNVNADNGLTGPVRCGAFAMNSANGQVGAGASFWGVMELSGNLAELYYNANSAGRVFCGLKDSNHGDGKLGEAGAADVTTEMWPLTSTAFALRGGSFKDPQERARISDREKHWGVFSTGNEVNGLKDSTMTFRLGRTAPVLRTVSEVTMENGRTSAIEAVDSVCSGVDYTIKGDIPSQIDGAYRIAWFQSSDDGATWDLIEGEESPTLRLYNLRNINSREDIFKDYYYKRYIYSNSVDVVQTHPVCLRVINHTLDVSLLKDTVDVYDRSEGIRVQVPQIAEFKWTWVRQSDEKPIEPEYVVKPGKIEVHYFAYKDFYDGSQFKGEQKIKLEINVMQKCALVDTFKVFVKLPPQEVDGYDLTTKQGNESFKCGDILIDNEENKGRKYRTIEIGGRCWFADNLNRELKEGQKGGAVCYGEKEANCDVYGRLYNFYAVTQTDYNTRLTDTEGKQGICPTGWHVPTNREWMDMVEALGSHPIDKDHTVTDGKFIKSQLNYWGGQSNPVDRIGTNTGRFTALPGGMKNYNYNGGAYSTYAGITGRSNDYWDLGERGWWWTSSTTGGVYTYWHANSNSWVTRFMPLYVRMDADAQIYFGIRYPYSTYGYVTNTIFQSDQSSGHNLLDYTNSNEGTALDRMKSMFYMSVRCIKNVTPAE